MPYYTYNIIKDLYFNTYVFNDKNDSVENQVLKKYSKDDKEQSGIELPDIITNINGSHIYKLISSKDIDWDNIYLPNSTVSNENWGTFDPSRRWNNETRIHINDVYELMNVIDYLLCSCSDLWNEINKLKYGFGNNIEIWFLNNTSEILKSSVNKLDDDDLSRKVGKVEETIFKPDATHVILNIPNFAIGTQFYVDVNDQDNYPIRRLFIQKSNKNGIQGLTKEEQKNYQFDKSESTPINGEIITIYGYKINDNGNEIRLFPGFNFDNYIYSNKLFKANDLVDINNQKIKYNNIYFKTNIKNNEFKEVYCEFLTINNTKGYILYYKEDDIKNIIYVHPNINNNQFRNKIDSYNKYIILTQNDLEEAYTYTDGGVIYPWLFVCNDEFTLDLTVETPTVENKFETTSKSITLYYYKDKNEINAKIYTDDIDKPIEKVEDISQSASLLTNKKRYNIPDNTNINIQIEADWVNNNPSILYDDEYMDYSVLPSSISNDNISSYYIYNNINLTTYTRTFINLSENPDYINNIGNKFNDVNSKTVVQLYQKTNNPYKLSYELVPNQLIVQDVNYNDIKTEIDIIKDNITLHQDPSILDKKENKAYILTFNHILPDDYEQIKFDINLKIDETSKVKKGTYTLPINLNKVHNPKLHYINYQDTKDEYNSYFDFEVTYIGTDQTANGRPIQYYQQMSFIQNSKMYELLDFYSIKSYMINGIYDKDPIDSQTHLENTFTEEQLKTNGNKTIIISYHPINSYVNLIGSNMTIAYLCQKLNKSLPFTQMSTIETIVGNNNVSIFNKIESNDNFNLLKNEYQSLFNIYGLGRKYRFKSGNSEYTHPLNAAESNTQKYNVNTNSINRIEEDKDIKNDNISYFLNYKFSNNYIKTYYIGNTRYENTGNYFDNDIYYVKTDIFNIYKTSYLTKYNLNNNINTYVFCPILYMDITGSTFYPNENTFPEPNHYYDLTDNNDISKYVNYVNAWDDDNNTKEMTLNLKLQENLSRGIPFFRETEETTLNFKINRCNVQSIMTTPQVAGNTIKILLDKKYYLSDLLNINIQNDNYKTCCIGSYPQWDEDHYKITEIFGQTNNYIKEAEYPNIYHYKDYIDNYLPYINIDPLLLNKIPDKYQTIYNISKLSEINKLHITSLKIIDPEDMENNTPINNNNDEYFEYDNQLKTFKLKNNNSVKTLLTKLSATQNNGISPGLKLSIPFDKIFGNLKYGGQSITTTTPNPYIIPVHRLFDETNINHVQDATIFPKITINNIDFQLLNFDETKTYYYYDNNQHQYKVIEKPQITINSVVDLQNFDFEQFKTKLLQYKLKIIEEFEAHNLFLSNHINQ